MKPQNRQFRGRSCTSFLCCELLGTPKAFVANGTDNLHIVVRVTTAAVLPMGALDSYMPSESCSVGMIMGYINSDHINPGDAHSPYAINELNHYQALYCRFVALSRVCIR